MEQPTKFEFVINLKTAKALGLTIRRRCWHGQTHLCRLPAPQVNSARVGRWIRAPAHVTPPTNLPAP